jgi:hypothetical protein
MKTIVSFGYDAHFVVPTADLGKFLETISGLTRVSKDYEEGGVVFRVEGLRLPDVTVVTEIKEAKS